MERKSVLVVGAQRHGKTYYTEQTAIKYAQNGGTSIAYNVGRPNDFAKFISITFITPKLMQRMALKQQKRIKDSELPFEIKYFQITGKSEIYHMKDFCKMFAGKCVKIEKLNQKYQEESLFFEVIYEYFYNCLIIFDDVRSITRHGLSSEFITISSRQNHCGVKYCNDLDMLGVDMFLIYHSFEDVSNEYYNHLNSIVQFKTIFPPALKKNNPELENLIMKNYEQLKELPKYTRIEMDILSLQQITIQPN